MKWLHSAEVLHSISNSIKGQQRVPWTGQCYIASRTHFKPASWKSLNKLLTKGDHFHGFTSPPLSGPATSCTARSQTDLWHTGHSELCGLWNVEKWNLLTRVATLTINRLCSRLPKSSLNFSSMFQVSLCKYVDRCWMLRVCHSVGRDMLVTPSKTERKQDRFKTFILKNTKKRTSDSGEGCENRTDDM